MRKFNKPSFGNRDSRPTSGRRSGGTRFGGGRTETKFSRPAIGRSSNKSSGFELYEVTCDKCGVKCDIPFKPTTNKPVYCRSCFRKNEGLEPRSGNDKFETKGRDRFESRGNDRFESRTRFEDELKTDRATKPTSDDADKLDNINRKLDRIMKALKIE